MEHHTPLLDPIKFRLLTSNLFLLVFCTGILSALFYRAYTVNNSNYSKIAACDNCFFTMAIMNDAIIYFGIFLAILLSIIVRYYVLRILLRMISVFLTILYVSDIIIYEQFNTRLYFEDVSKYAVKLEPVISQAYTTLGNAWLMYLTGFVTLVILGFIFISRISGTFSRVMLSGITMIFLVLSLLPISSTYIHSWVYKNFLELNIGNTQTAKYSNNYKKQLALTYKGPDTHCTNGLAEKPNIILLVVESLSSYQSKLLTGFSNLLPNLDDLAKNSTYYTQFLANHWATNPGLVHLLTGNVVYSPADGGKRFHPFETAWDNENTIPEFLVRYGYHSAFLTSGNLAFAKMREWLNHIGFDYVEGSDFEGYDGKPRTGFRAVSDEVLFDRSLLLINELDAQNKSYFLTINSMSTHQPYIHPETRERSLEKTFRYTDEKIYDFYNKLEKAGFFENGILMITGDHRSMTPIQAEEFEKYGLLAPALIPMIVVSRNPAIPKGDISMPLQQSDIFNSIKYLVSDNYCTADNRRNLFKQDSRERILVHSRGDLRDRMNVFYGRGHGVVQLNGDDTEFTQSTDIPDHIQRQIVEFINHERIQGDRRQMDAIANGMVPY